MDPTTGSVPMCTIGPGLPGKFRECVQIDGAMLADSPVAATRLESMHTVKTSWNCTCTSMDVAIVMIADTWRCSEAGVGFDLLSEVSSASHANPLPI